MRIKIWISGIFIMGLLNNCDAQSPEKKTLMEEQPKNPVICDTEKGICETPGHQHQGKITDMKDKPGKVKMIYFTDPICSACWSIEPQLRRFLLEYGHLVELEYHMGGLLPSWDVYNAGGISKPSDVAHHWEEMSAYFGMPIDGDVWLSDPLMSSYPPCMAFKAAELQSNEKAAKFLRRMREMVMLEKSNIAKWEVLQVAAHDCGLDSAKLRDDYRQHATALFQSDLELAARFGVRGFPAIYFRDGEGNQTVLYGFSEYQKFEEAIRRILPSAEKKAVIPKNALLFDIYPAMTMKEFSLINGITDAQSLTELSELEKAGRVTKQPSKNGPIWRSLK